MELFEYKSTISAMNDVKMKNSMDDFATNGDFLDFLNNTIEDQGFFDSIDIQSMKHLAFRLENDFNSFDCYKMQIICHRIVNFIDTSLSFCESILPDLEKISNFPMKNDFFQDEKLLVCLIALSKLISYDTVSMIRVSDIMIIAHATGKETSIWALHCLELVSRYDSLSLNQIGFYERLKYIIDHPKSPQQRISAICAFSPYMHIDQELKIKKRIFDWLINLFVSSDTHSQQAIFQVFIEFVTGSQIQLEYSLRCGLFEISEKALGCNCVNCIHSALFLISVYLSSEISYYVDNKVLLEQVLKKCIHLLSNSNPSITQQTGLLIIQIIQTKPQIYESFGSFAYHQLKEVIKKGSNHEKIVISKIFLMLLKYNNDLLITLIEDDIMCDMIEIMAHFDPISIGSTCETLLELSFRNSIMKDFLISDDINLSLEGVYELTHNEILFSLLNYLNQTV